MFEDKGILMLPLLRRLILVLVCGSGCLLFSGPSLADEAMLPADHGYLLIRLRLSSRERAGKLAMSEVDTNDVFRISTKLFEPAGANAWMALVAMPSGRYYWSAYEPNYGVGSDVGQSLDPIHRRRSPASASDTFEIVPGVINYIGDWNMRVVSASRTQFDPIIEFDKSTLELYVTQYPEYANKYEIYLSIMGKKAISLREVAKNSAEKSESS